MVHARLGIAEENSGKLVSLVRKQAQDIAAEHGLDTVIYDGPPGIGCPVIASVGGATSALIVTEPTVSGIHDMERAIELCRHFKVPVMVCILQMSKDPMPEVIKAASMPSACSMSRSSSNIIGTQKSSIDQRCRWSRPTPEIGPIQSWPLLPSVSS